MAINPTGADMKAFLAVEPDEPIVMQPGYQEGTHLRTEALVEAVPQPTRPA